MHDIYTGLLKAFPLRMIGNIQPVFTYNNSNPFFKQLESSCHIADIAGGGTEFSKVLNLLKWVSKHNYHKGNFNMEIRYNSIELLNYSYNKDAEHGINGVCLSIILSECLLSIGLKARPVFMMTCSPYDGDKIQ